MTRKFFNFRNCVIAGSLGWMIGSMMKKPEGEEDGVWMNSEDFNAKQNQTQLASELNNLSEANIALYRLKSCPYCEKIKVFLNYFHVPYHEVLVDPVTSYGLPKVPYDYVPQLQFLLDKTERAHPAELNPESKGPFLVESEVITNTLAKHLGLGDQLRDPRVNDARKWIKDHYTRVTFAAMNGTYYNARRSFYGLVPSKYHFFPCAWVGGAILNFTARRKTIPKIQQELEKMGDAQLAKEVNMEKVLLVETNKFAERLLSVSNGEDRGKRMHENEEKQEGHASDLFSRNEKEITDKIPILENTGGEGEGKNTATQETPNREIFLSRPFHGGETPDIADLELYGVLMTAYHAPHVQKVIKDSKMNHWYKNMEKIVSSS